MGTKSRVDDKMAEFWTQHAGHEHHLCSLVARRAGTFDEYKDLVRDPKFICGICGRVAHDEKNLCEPHSL